MPAETIGYSQLASYSLLNYNIHFNFNLDIILCLFLYCGLRGKVPHSSLGGNRSMKITKISGVDKLMGILVRISDRAL